MGTIEIICGCMFSGKTGEMILRLRRARIANQRILAFYPKRDTNPKEHKIIAWGQNEKDEWIVIDSYPAHPVDTKKEMWALIEKYYPEVLAIDEAQFFNKQITEFLEELRDDRKIDVRIIVAGLDRDYMKKPFGHMPDILALADNGVTKLSAVCMRCHMPANYTQRLEGTAEQIMVGKKEYEARCLRCHYTYKNPE